MLQADGAAALASSTGAQSGAGAAAAAAHEGPAGAGSASADLDVLHRVTQRIAGELDLDTIVQRLTLEAKQLCRAELGGFPPKVAVPSDRVIRVDDVSRDPRYAKAPPDLGIAAAHAPFRSYLVAPVRSPRTNEVFGGLALGHSSPGAFTVADERTIATIAVVAALSIEHARLLERARTMEREYARRARQATLAADVAGALARSGGLRSTLQRCAEAVVRNLDAAFARIWTLDPEGNVLELQASAGMYTHLDGEHARVAVGALKIGRIAAENEPHLTNSVSTDSWIGDRGWAMREGLNAFAGYPLAYQGRVVGVLALFARRPLAVDTIDSLGAISDTLAVGIARSRADDDLRKSEIRHRLVVESSQDGIWFWDLQKNVVHWNDRLFDMTGVRREQGSVSMEELLARVHPNDRDRMKRALDAHLEEGHPYVVEDFGFLDGAGEYRTCITKGLAETGPQGGRPVRMAASITDITDRRRAEHALVKERARFFELLMNAPAAIAFVEGRAHRFVFVNEQYAALMQRPLLGERASAVFAEGSRWASDLEQVFATGEAMVGREIPIAHDGTSTPRFFDVTYEPMRTSSGGIDGILIHAVEVSRQVEARRQVEKANEELEARVEDRTAALIETNRELEAFSYTVSHDLRAPIRHIAGFVDLLRLHAGSSLDPKSTRYVDTIGGAAKQMGLLIDGLLAFSRMGRAALTKRVVDGQQLLKEIVEALEPDVEGRDVEFKLGQVPLLYGDATMLRVVLTNLLANAVKYSSRTAHAVIEVGHLSVAELGERFAATPSAAQASRASQHVVLFVRDNGVGFDMAHIDKLFGVFQRLHGADEFEGTGIGLATVRRIVLRHGGRVWAESKLNEGATFYLSLPQTAEETE